MSLTTIRASLIVLPGFALFLIAASLSGRAAMAGAIIATAPSSEAQGDSFNWQSIPNGPLIEFGLSGKDKISDPSDGLDDIQQPYVPWIIQDRRSLDWFGGPEDILSAGDGNSRNPVTQRTMINPDLPPPSTNSYDDLPVRAYVDTSRDRDIAPGPDEPLDMTLTKLVAGIFQSLGYVNTVFVLGPILVIALFLGLMHLVKILRVYQGLDPEQGKHRWGIQSDGDFGRVRESNDNGGRSRRKKRDVA